MKDVPLGRSTATGTGRQRSNFFSHLLLLFLTPKISFNIGFGTLPKIGAAADAKCSIGNPFPLCFFFL